MGSGPTAAGSRARTFLDFFVRLGIPLRPLRAVALVDELQARAHGLGGALANDDLGGGGDSSRTDRVRWIHACTGTGGPSNLGVAKGAPDRVEELLDVRVEERRGVHGELLEDQHGRVPARFLAVACCVRRRQGTRPCFGRRQPLCARMRASPQEPWAAPCSHSRARLISKSTRSAVSVPPAKASRPARARTYVHARHE